MMAIRIALLGSIPESNIRVLPPARSIRQFLRMTFLFFSILAREFRQDNVRVIWITTFWSWAGYDVTSIVAGFFSGNDGPSIERGVSGGRRLIGDGSCLVIQCSKSEPVDGNLRIALLHQKDMKRHSCALCPLRMSF